MFQFMAAMCHIDVSLSSFGFTPRACIPPTPIWSTRSTIKAMPYLPPFIAPTRYNDPAAALAQIRAIYEQQIAHLRDAMQRYVAGETMPGHVRACYPFVRIHTETVARAILETPDISQLSYGFVAGPGRYETTLTRPDLYGDYYLEQFRLLLQNHNVELEVGTSSQPRVSASSTKPARPTLMPRITRSTSEPCVIAGQPPPCTKESYVALVGAKVLVSCRKQPTAIRVIQRVSI